MKYPYGAPNNYSWYVAAFEKLPNNLARELVSTPHGLVWAYGIDWALVEDVANSASLEELDFLQTPRNLNRIGTFYWRALGRRKNEVSALQGDDV